MSAGDRIELRGLRALGRCGALPEEQTRAQPLEVDLDVFANLAAAGASDDLGDTIDYAALASVAERVVTSGHHRLLEALAERIAATILADERVEQVTVAVRKLRPPVPHALDTAGVRISRAR